MADLNGPSILGFPITPWLIILFISLIGIIVSLILILSALAKKDKTELELIKKAAINTTKIPVKDISTTSLLYDSKTDNETEAISYTEETEIITNSNSGDVTERVDIGTEGLLIGTEQTEALLQNEQTQSLDFRASSFENETEVI